jgi:hypothetical protein
MLHSTKLLTAGFKEYCAETSKYPPIWLFAGIANPTPKDKKSELRCIQVSEKLYSLNNTLLGGLRSSWNEVQNMYNFSDNIKEKFCVGVVAKFDAYLKHVDKEFEMQFKQELLLKDYYEKFRVQKSIRDSIFILLCSDINTEPKDLSTEYKELVQAELRNIKEIHK